jgi:hypothetical protein
VSDLSDYELAWPRDLFVDVATGLLADYPRLAEHWFDVVDLLLTESFSDSHVAGAWRDDSWLIDLPPAWVEASGDLPHDDQALVRILVNHVDDLPAASGRRPYWTQRKSGATPLLDTAATARGFARVVDKLYNDGYFDLQIPKHCPDDPSSGLNPDEILADRLGRVGLWPLKPGDWDDDTFFDLIEVFHDLAWRPRRRWWHNWNNCGWHVFEHDRRSGQRVYRWQVNDLLAHSEIPYRLADAGEDVGRLVAVTDDARDELAATIELRTDPATGDRVRHALAQFRSRAATEHDKRSANITLAGVLEERRNLLKAELLSKDEAALFEIANRFAIRHQNEQQKRDYDAVFLDWVFWLYLATIELTDRLLARQLASPPA